MHGVSGICWVTGRNLKKRGRFLTPFDGFTQGEFIRQGNFEGPFLGLWEFNLIAFIVRDAGVLNETGHLTIVGDSRT